MSDRLKETLADAVHELLKQDASRSMLRIEVTRLGPLQTQFKVWPAEGGAPRYFLVSVKESLT